MPHQRSLIRKIIEVSGADVNAELEDKPIIEHLLEPNPKLRYGASQVFPPTPYCVLYAPCLSCQGTACAYTQLPWSCWQCKAHPFFRSTDWEHILDTEPPFIPDLEDATDTSYFDARGNSGVSMVEEDLGASMLPMTDKMCGKPGF